MCVSELIEHKRYMLYLGLKQVLMCKREMIIQADFQFFAAAEAAKQAKYVKIFLKYHEMVS